MAKEISYRLTRIFLVIVFVLFLFLVRENVQANYNEANKIISNIPEVTVTNLNNEKGKNVLSKKYEIQIKNVSNKDKKISFVIKGNKNFPYNYVNYRILKDNTIVNKGIITKDGTIYYENMKKNDKIIYEVEFWVNDNDMIDLKTYNLNAKLSFV